MTAAAPLAAQDTLLVAQDTLVADSMAVAGEQLQVGRRVHIVQGGETLWTLAERYLDDPLLWPEIYRLNTLVVEDPHWIFPGEALRLVPPDTTMVAAIQVGDSLIIPQAGDSVMQGDSVLVRVVQRPAVDSQATVRALPPPPPPPTTMRRATAFRQRGAQNQLGLTVIRNPPRHLGGLFLFFSAGYLTEGDDLPWADLMGSVNRSTLPTLVAASAAQIYQEIELRAPENAVYQPGDTIILSELGRRIQGSWGRVVKPTGVAEVIAVSRRSVRATIVMQFGRVADGQVALPIEPYQDRAQVEPVPIENGMMASVIAMRDVHPVATLRDILFINRGRTDGLVPGDVFEILAPAPNTSSGEDFPRRRIALVEVVHVRNRSASVVVTHIVDVGIRPGADIVARLIRKMP
ncbi:MAG: LysM peptidoglycan-binding domain-containing protein [Gemmatimonadetes bacterium]|nr:LysM peptidoglycan-binding domain-containing protein [Gemmatimonadota bacterium]